LPQSLTGPQLVRALSEGEATLIVGVPRLYGALYPGIEARVGSGGAALDPDLAEKLEGLGWRVAGNTCLPTSASPTTP
jgi:hypothetical protein